MSDVVREIQASTFQLPCGEHSAYAAYVEKLLHSGHFGLYVVLTVFGNWESGWSHALSYGRLAHIMGVPRSTVILWMNHLISAGWVEKKVRGGNRPNTYRVVHYRCDALEVPLDKDGRAKKCAIPMGEGSAVSKLRKTGISAFVGWIVAKIESCWVSGVVALTIRQAEALWHMGRQTICAIYKTWEKFGLAERVSPAGGATVLQLYPKPYEARRTRRHENPKFMRCDGEFYYSFNEWWRVSRDDGHIETLIEGTSKWRHANEKELELANVKILRDFRPIIDLATSSTYQRYRLEATP